jgi:hypothetical protein
LEDQEFTSIMAKNGPLGRLLPVTIDNLELSTILAATQAVQATDRGTERVASEIFRTVGDLLTRSADDERRLVLGRDLVFVLSRDEDELVVQRPEGEERRSTLP